MLLDTEFEAKKVSIEDADDIIELINKYYSEENNRDFQRKWKDFNQFNAIRVRLKLQQNWSFGVFEKSSKKLAAVMLCCVQESQLESTKSEIEHEGLHLSTELQNLGQFYAKLEANVYEILNTEKLFYTGMVTVHSKYRKRGIASFLFETSQKLAAEAKCDYVVATPTNDFLSSSLARRGWTILREFKFKDYDCQNGTHLFPNPAYPRTKACFACKKVEATQI